MYQCQKIGSANSVKFANSANFANSARYLEYLSKVLSVSVSKNRFRGLHKVRTFRGFGKLRMIFETPLKHIAEFAELEEHVSWN